MNENRRRSVFGAQSSQQFGDSGPVPESHVQPCSTLAPRSVLDQLTYAEPRRRSHTISPSQRPGQVSYRGFPKEILEAIRLAAGELQVSTDDLVRAMLEYALGVYWSGKLDLDPLPGKLKMTLYPTGQQTPKAAQVKRQKRKKAEAPRWTGVVTYRGIPKTVKDGVKQIASEQDIPVGEVAAFLIQFGIHAFRNGNLALRPLPKSGSNTLFTEG